MDFDDINEEEFSKLDLAENELLNLENKTILFVGKTGSGKSTLINDILNTNAKVGNTASSCTTEIREYKERGLICIDTPGLTDTEGRDDIFLEKLHKSLKCLKYDILCVVLSVDRRADKDFQGLTNLYLKLLDVTNQSVNFIFTKDVEIDFMRECISKIKQENSNINFLTMKYYKTRLEIKNNIKPDIIKILKRLHFSISDFSTCEIKKLETKEKNIVRIEKEKTEINKALYLIEQKLKDTENKNKEEIRQMTEKLIQQKSQFETKKMMLETNYVVNSDSRYCTATTQKGTRCSRLSQINRNYCWQH